MKSTTFFLDQHRESFLEQVTDSEITVRYAFLRSLETRDKNKQGEDFLAFHLEAGKVAFALCDGVSQSFSGFIASQRLGKKLLEWLWTELQKLNLPVSPTDKKANLATVKSASAQLTHVLNDYCVVVTEEIDKNDLSHMQIELLKEVLAERRDQHGTQSNFTCGYIEVPSKAFPYGRMILFWLGDAKLRRLVGGRDFTSELAESWNTEERWSSKQGVIGEIHSYMDITYKVSTLVSHSDGLDPFPTEWYRPLLASDVLNEHLKSLWDRPSSDDVSFIEIDVQNVNYPKLPVPIPAPIGAEKAAAAAVDRPLVHAETVPAGQEAALEELHVPLNDLSLVEETGLHERRKADAIEKLPRQRGRDSKGARGRARVISGRSQIMDVPPGDVSPEEPELGLVAALRKLLKDLFG